MVLQVVCLPPPMATVSFCPQPAIVGIASFTMLAATAIIGRVRFSRTIRTSHGASTSTRANTPCTTAAAAMSVNLSEQCAPHNKHIIKWLCEASPCRVRLCWFVGGSRRTPKFPKKMKILPKRNQPAFCKSFFRTFAAVFKKRFL